MGVVFICPISTGLGARVEQHQCQLSDFAVLSPSIHGSTYTPSLPLASHTTTVFQGSPCDSTTPSHLRQQLEDATPTYPSPPQSRSRKRTSMGAPLSTRYTVSHRTRPTFALPLLSRRPQIALSVYNLQSMSTIQRQFNGYVFNVTLCPLVTSSSFFSRCQCEQRNRIFGTTGKVRRVHRD